LHLLLFGSSSQRLEEAARFQESQPSTITPVLESEPSHSSEIDLAIRSGHAETVAAVGTAALPADDDVIAVGCRSGGEEPRPYCMLGGEGVQKSFAPGLELGGLALHRW